MSVKYKNAPLVELIAELRWGDSSLPQAVQQGPAIQFAIPQSKDEEIFMHFGAIVSA